MDLEVTFANAAQEAFYYATARNQCFSGGFNNGKTYAGCLKAFTLLTTFPNYRMSLSRQVRADLMKTTYQTFFKICPRELVERNNEQEGFTILKNKSIAYWIHLDKAESSTLRGFELNSNLTDQAEEMQEETYDILDSRIGRWDHADIPEFLLKQNPYWPKNPKTGRLLAPSYNMLLCNPDTQFHFIFRKFHPDSLERRENFFYIEGEWDTGLGSYEAFQEASKHDSEWVDKYIKGQWGRSSAQIHRLPTSSLLQFTPELLDRIRRKGNLFRVLDHGDTAPTSCLWCAALDGNFIFYREYYTPNQIISYHRKSIHELSAGETYSGNYADPSIFRKEPTKKGGMTNVADEYITKDIPSPPLYWLPADNNEFATRNRINELLHEQEGVKHPVTGEIGKFPKIYFVVKSEEYPFGCFNAVKEIQSQRRKLIGYVDGKAYYSDEREESVADHAYDGIRYLVAAHGKSIGEPRRPVKPGTFNWYKMMKMRKENLFPPVPMVQ